MSSHTHLQGSLHSTKYMYIDGLRRCHALLELACAQRIVLAGST
jgi:hypothetical protein